MSVSENLESKTEDMMSNSDDQERDNFDAQGRLGAGGLPLLHRKSSYTIEGVRKVTWEPSERYVEPVITQAESYGCEPEWYKHISSRLLCDWLLDNRQEILAGITVTLTLVPTAVAFALLANVDPGIGLTGSWIIGLIAALFGGRTGMIYCSAGAVAVVVVSLVRSDGVEYMFYCFILAGIIMTALALLGVAHLVKLIPNTCMIGFVNGLAIVIFLAQLENFQVSDPNRFGRRRLNSFDVFENPDWLPGDVIAWMLANVAITMFVNLVTPRFTKVPAALLAIIVSTIFEWGIVRGAAGYETPIIKDVAEVSGSFPKPIWMDDQYDLPPINGDLFKTIFPTALTVTAVSLIEVLMTVKLVDEITETRGDPHVESFWLGIGNIVAGAFGGQGGNSEIGLTMINLQSGGRLRLSGVLVAILTLVVIVALYPVINILPLAGLIGVMFVVCYKTFDWNSLAILLASALPQKWRESHHINLRQKINRMDALIIIVVTIVTPFTNLAVAVGIGSVIAMLGFAWKSSSNVRVVAYCREGYLEGDPPIIKVYEVLGPIFYASGDSFLSKFSHHDDPDLIELHFSHADIMDYSAMQAINTLGDRYTKVHKRLRLRRVKPECLKALQKANELLMDEVVLELEEEAFSPTPALHLNVENFEHFDKTRLSLDNERLRRRSAEYAERREQARRGADGGRPRVMTHEGTVDIEEQVAGISSARV